MTTSPPIKLVVDCTTGVTEEVPFTQEEIDQWNADQASALAAQQAQAAVDAQFEKDRLNGLAKLEALGLNANEAVAVARRHR